MIDHVPDHVRFSSWAEFRAGYSPGLFSRRDRSNVMLGACSAHLSAMLAAALERLDEDPSLAQSMRVVRFEETSMGSCYEVRAA